MKAVKKYSEGGIHFKLVEVDEPALQNGNDVKIEIDSIGICTSDIHVLHGAMEMPDGNIVGHEFSGRIIEMGNSVNKAFSIGDRVVCELAKGACFNCKLCHSGHYELCPQKQPPGWKSQGIYTRYTVQPDYCLHKVPESVPMDVAALTEPVAICTYGILERGRIQKEDFTVIYGMGPIGLLSLITLLDYGLKNVICVTSTRHSTARLDLAVELGATQVFSTEQDIPKEVLKLNNGWKADCVIDCSGAPQAINQGLSLLNKGGKFIALGITNESQISFSFNTAILNVLDVIFSATSSHTAWNKAIGILERNPEKIKKVITHTFPLSEWQRAYQKVENREAIKVILTPILV